MREISAGEACKLYECLEALAEHHNRVSVHFSGHYPVTPSGERIRQFEKELEAGTARIAVAESGDKVIGFCKISISGRSGVLEYLVVLDEERGKGWGAALMDWAFSCFREAGATEIEVKVVYGNDAIHLYEKYGFRPKSILLGLDLQGGETEP